MLINDIILEADQAQSTYKKIGIMSGRFHPPHIGHMKGWQWLRSKFDDAYIATSDKVDPPRSPFTFQEKKAMFVHAGVPNNRVVQVRDPYKVEEIASQFDPQSTVFIFGVSEKDMTEQPRFQFKPKKDGSPGYLQSYSENMSKLQPISTHAYIIVVPTFKFDVAGKPMRSATEFRADFAQSDDSRQARMIQDLYGDYDDNIHAIMRAKIG